MAEAVKFELTEGYQPSTVFKTVALNRSATLPSLEAKIIILLLVTAPADGGPAGRGMVRAHAGGGAWVRRPGPGSTRPMTTGTDTAKIGRASCRERV